MRNLFEDIEPNGPFIPVAMCLDVSGSMKDRIPNLKEGLKQFIQDVRENEKASVLAEGAIITFADDVKLIQSFSKINDWGIPKLEANGRTDLVGAVEYALQILQERKDYHKSIGNSYNQPWLVILTDGAQCPKDPNGIDRVASKVVDLVKKKKLVCFPTLVCLPTGVEDRVAKDDLKKFHPDHIAIQLKNGTSFKDFFEFFSQSLIQSSQSVQGNQFDFEIFQKAFNLVR
ncbi:VWA domain-containing protein [bacterium]|nr:VWA domain-containing protein [bacterium]MBR0192552.1 VWA domain-containing protein [Thermoguttaceae bacterium]